MTRYIIAIEGTDSYVDEVSKSGSVHYTSEKARALFFPAATAAHIWAFLNIFRYRWTVEPVA